VSRTPNPNSSDEASERDKAQADEASGEGSAASHDAGTANDTEARYGKDESGPDHDVLTTPSPALPGTVIPGRFARDPAHFAVTISHVVRTSTRVHGGVRARGPLLLGCR
jgi:hypothetical protein